MRMMLICGTALLLALSAITQAQEKPLKPVPAKRGEKESDLLYLTCPLWPVDWDPSTGHYYYACEYNDDECNFVAYSYLWGYYPNAPISPCDPGTCLPNKDVAKQAERGDESGRRSLPPDGAFQRGELPPEYRRHTRPAQNTFSMKFDHDGDGVADKIVRFHNGIEIFPQKACRDLGHANCDKLPESQMLNLGFERHGNPNNFNEVPRENVQNITRGDAGANSKFIITIGEEQYLVFLRNL